MYFAFGRSMYIRSMFVRLRYICIVFGRLRYCVHEIFNVKRQPYAPYFNTKINFVFPVHPKFYMLFIILITISNYFLNNMY
jgi:hypothetical protein